MAKEAESEGQTLPQTDDPWSAGDDPWTNAKQNESETMPAREIEPVSDSPVSQSFSAPTGRAKEEEAKTDEKGQTVTGDTVARSFPDYTAETKTDQEEKKDVKEKPEVTEKTIHTPDNTTNRALWPTPWQSSWWSSPLQN